jgi:hypothetical protein
MMMDESFIILVEDIINIIGDAFDLEVSCFPIPQEVILALLAAPSLAVTDVRLPRLLVSGHRHALLRRSIVILLSW